MSTDPTSTDVPPLPETADSARLAEELEREKQEVLRLRDLLIARDAELGAARGRLAELEDTAGRLLGRAKRLRELLSRG